MLKWANRALFRNDHRGFPVSLQGLKPSQEAHLCGTGKDAPFHKQTTGDWQLTTGEATWPA
jgi:hypothetical protein